MRRIALLCCLLLTTSAFAKDFKVGTVDIAKLFDAYPGTQKAKEKLTEWEKKKKDELAPTEQELKDLNNDLANSSLLSDKQKAKKKKEFDEKYAAFQQEAEEVQNELVVKQNEMKQEILDKIKKVVGDVAKNDGVDLVLDDAEAIYSKDSVDLTDDVLKAFKSVKDDDDSKN